MPISGQRRAVKAAPTVPASLDGALAVVDAEYVEELPSAKVCPLVEVVLPEAENRPLTPARIADYARNSERRLVFEGLSHLSGHEAETIERLFRTRNDVAMLVLCQDAGLDYGQSCIVLQKIGHVPKLRSIPSPIIEEMRRFIGAPENGQ